MSLFSMTILANTCKQYMSIIDGFELWLPFYKPEHKFCIMMVRIQFHIILYISLLKLVTLNLSTLGVKLSGSAGLCGFGASSSFLCHFCDKYVPLITNYICRCFIVDSNFGNSVCIPSFQLDLFYKTHLWTASKAVIIFDIYLCWMICYVDSLSKWSH